MQVDTISSRRYSKYTVYYNLFSLGMQDLENICPTRPALPRDVPCEKGKKCDQRSTVFLTITYFSVTLI